MDLVKSAYAALATLPFFGAPASAQQNLSGHTGEAVVEGNNNKVIINRDSGPKSSRTDEHGNQVEINSGGPNFPKGFPFDNDAESSHIGDVQITGHGISSTVDLKSTVIASNRTSGFMVQWGEVYGSPDMKVGPVVSPWHAEACSAKARADFAVAVSGSDNPSSCQHFIKPVATPGLKP